jgi:hypothetical protein
MPHSVIEAIKLGQWDYEPEGEKPQPEGATRALPGTNEKLAVLARRVEEGLPLWHPSDRLSFEEREE